MLCFTFGIAESLVTCLPVADPATMRRVLSDKPPGVLNIGGVRARFMPDVDVEPVDELMINRDGLLNVVPSQKLLKEFPAETLTAWCVKRGVYQLPTEELLDWLFRRIAGRNAIEISAGNGVIGRTLGIPTTDSYQQTQPHIASYYHALGQEPITPPPDVERVAANTAVRRYEPEVVIGAWVTQIWRANDNIGNVDGVDENDIIERVQEYIHIGNDAPHGHKRIMCLEPQRHRFNWLLSRAFDQSLNHIHVYGLNGVA